MPASKSVIASKNRMIRQEALREQLSNQGHVQHIIDMVDKVRNADIDIEPAMVNRYKIAIDAKLALIKKYIPDLKAVELSGDENAPILVHQINRKIIDGVDNTDT